MKQMNNDSINNGHKAFEILAWISFALMCLTVSSPLILYKYLSLIPAMFTAFSFLFTFLYEIKKKKIGISLLTIIYIAFVLIASFITLIVSKRFYDLKTLVNIFLLFFTIVFFVSTFNNSKLMLLIYSGSVCLLCLAFFAFYFPRIIANIRNITNIRLGSDFDNENSLGFTFLTGLVSTLGLAFCKTKRGMLKTLYISFSSLLFVVAIVLTGSRAALLGSFVTLLTFAFLTLYKNHIIALIVVFISILISCIIVLNLPAFASLKTRLLSLFSLGSAQAKYDASVTGRISMIFDGFQYSMKRLFFGYGAGGFSSITNHNSYSHATLPELLCNYGMIGFILFLSPFFVILIKSRRNKFVFNNTILLVFGILLIGMFGTVLLEKKAFFVLYGIYFGSFLSLKRTLVKKIYIPNPFCKKEFQQ